MERPQPGRRKEPAVEKKGKGMLERVRARVLQEQKQQESDSAGWEFDRLVQVLGSLGKARRFQQRVFLRRFRRSKAARIRRALIETGQINPRPEPLRLRDRMRRCRWNGTLRTPRQLYLSRRKRLRKLAKEARRLAR